MFVLGDYPIIPEFNPDFIIFNSLFPCIYIVTRNIRIQKMLIVCSHVENKWDMLLHNERHRMAKNVYGTIFLSIYVRVEYFRLWWCLLCKQLLNTQQKVYSQRMANMCYTQTATKLKLYTLCQEIECFVVFFLHRVMC